DSQADYLTGSISVSTTIFDNYQLYTVLIQFRRPDNSIIGNYIMNNPGGNTYTYTWNVGGEIPGTNYRFIIIANDTIGNINNSEIGYFDIVDNIDPAIGLANYNTPINYLTGMLIVNVTVTDNYKLRTIAPVNISIYYPNGTLIIVDNMTNIGGNLYQYNWLVGSSPIGANYYFIIGAIDNQSNTAVSPAYYFNIADVENPKVTIDGYDTAAEYDIGTIQVNVTVTDNYALRPVNPVEIEFYTPGGSWINTYAMSNTGGNQFTYTETVLASLGYTLGTNYYFIIIATDAGGRINNTEMGFFDIVDTIGPIIENETVDDPLFSYDIGEIVTFTVDANDIPSGIDNVTANLYNLSNNALMDTRLLSSGSGNSFLGTFNTSGYSAGIYYFFIEAYDTAFNLATKNTSLTLVIFLNEIISLEFDFANITVNIGYIGEDNIDFLVAFRAYDSVKGGFENVADINITAIYIQFGDAGEWDNYFIFSSLNISLANGLVLTGSASYTWVTISYSINKSAPTTEHIGLGGHIYAMIDYHDLLSLNAFTDNRSIRGSHITEEINIYEVPDIYNLIMTPNSGYLGGANLIEFRVYGTHYGNIYHIYLNLTATPWNGGIVEITGVWLNNSYYYYSITNIGSGVYYGSDVNVIINTTVAGFKENNTERFSGNFKVDSLDPIIDPGYIIIPETCDIDGFWVMFNISDNIAGPIGTISGIDYITLYISSTHKGEYKAPSHTVYLQLISNISATTKIWGLYLDANSLDAKNFAYGDGKEKIEFGFLSAYDKAGNLAQIDLGTYEVRIIDETDPIIVLDELVLGDGENEITDGKTEMPAGEYISIKVKIDDGGNISSGIYYVRVYFKIQGDSGTETSADDDYSYIELAAMGNGIYFGVLSAPDQVGFKSSQKLIFYIEVSDFAGNTATSEDDPIEVSFKSELPIFSYIVLFASLACFIGAIAFRLSLYRRRARIIDLDSKIIKQKK
ncbi:MAG: hypothetical protein ACTSQJ_08540, partial [Promethearchaeota archaeon]